MKAVRVRLCLLLASAAGSFGALAQPFTTPPAAAAPRPLAIAAPVEGQLANGLRVIVARREGVPLVSAALVALTGSEADPPELPGLAAMSAALLTQGTRHHTAPQLAAAAEALGGSLDSGAGWNQATVGITVTTPRLDAALGLVAEVASEPLFAAEELDRIRSQALDGMKVAYTTPGALAGIVAARLAYGEGPYGHPSSGTPQSLPRIQRADLVAFHRKTFRPDHAVLILAGDIDGATAMALARKHFAAWRNPPGGASEALAPTPADVASAPSVAVVDMAHSGQAAVVISLPLPARSGNEPAVGAVLNAVLGGGYSSRLGEEIRIKRGLSYDASSSVEALRESALLRVSVQTKNESADEVVRLAQAEVDRLVQTPIDAAELAARKATLIGSLSRSVETTAGLVGAIRGYVVTRRSPAELTRRTAAIEAVRADDVQRYAAAHLGAANRRVVVVAGEAKIFETALKAAQPGLATVTAEGLDPQALVFH